MSERTAAITGAKEMWSCECRVVATKGVPRISLRDGELKRSLWVAVQHVPIIMYQLLHRLDRSAV